MRLISKEVITNSDTFAPELVVTLAIPMEPMKQSSVDEDEFATIIGNKLLSLLREQK